MVDPYLAITHGPPIGVPTKEKRIVTSHARSSEDTTLDLPSNERERQLIVRDAMLCALEDAGGTLDIGALAKKAGLSKLMCCVNAKQWPSYFTIDYSERQHNVLAIRLHPHLQKVSA